jgi:uncharacterized membrane protein YeaQ/YmgE (transglycosylase-associated protein family)
MSVLDFLLLALIASVCGAIGQALAGYSLGGCVVSAVVGYIGALLGLWMARQLALPELLVVNVAGRPFPIVWSIIGSMIFAVVIGLLTRERAR